MSEPGTPAASPPRRQVYRARVERVHDHNSDTRSLFLSLVNGGRLAFIPGQFISISLALENETRVRPYTLASSPEDTGAIEICFNRVPGGVGVRYLFERKAGDELQFTGPFGAFTMERAPEQECVFIAEGTAIAPIRPMLHRAQSAAHAPMLLIYAAGDRAHILYTQELERLASNDAAFHFEMMIDDRIYERLHDEVKRRWVEADSNRARQFYICGVGKDVTRIRDLLRGSGYQRRAVHYEQW